MKSIFISIAAYRDSELVPTIKDCIEKAKHPERLTFCVCWQHHGDDEFNEDYKELLESEYLTCNEIITIDVDALESKGVCWARNLIQKEYDWQDYILQLDSHHRFVENWDEIAIKTLNDLEGDNIKPVLTTYLPSYDPENGKTVQHPWELRFDRFIPQGPALPKPITLEDWRERDTPVLNYMYSAHFVFARGEYYKDVLYDPDLYFHGEEPSMAIRSYTHGYDLYNPHIVIAWHHYTREMAKRHWDDNSQDWTSVNNKSFSRYRDVMEMQPANPFPEEFGLGTVRTLDDYIEFSGIDVRNKRIHPTVADVKTRPPINKPLEEYKPFFKYCIDLNSDLVPYDDYDTWVIAFKNKDGEEIYRKDLDPGTIKHLKSERKRLNSHFFNIWIEWVTEEKPISWLVWPHSEEHDWCEMVTGDINYEF